MKSVKVIAKDKLIVRKSFAMPYSGGSIFFIQLDALSIYTDIVIDKFDKDVLKVSKPSESGNIAVNLNETALTEEMCIHIVNSFCEIKRPLHKVCFVGLDRDSKHIIKKEFSKHSRTGFGVGYIDDYEKAKQWLVCDE